MCDRYYCTNRRKYNLKAHIVLVTKYRKALLQYGIEEQTKKSVNALAEQKHWNIVAMETDRDHIHILLEYDATERICDIVGLIKRQTTHSLWTRYDCFLSKHYRGRHMFWSDGYFVCSIGEVSTATIEKYIANQG